LASFQEADRHTGGVGYVFRRLDDQVHCTIDVKLSARHQALHFHDRGERLTIHPTFLDCKHAG
jgi:hypothetical protein